MSIHAGTKLHLRRAVALAASFAVYGMSASTAYAQSCDQNRLSSVTAHERRADACFHQAYILQKRSRAEANSICASLNAAAKSARDQYTRDCVAGRPSGKAREM